MALERLTWGGLLVVIAGWMLLLAGLVTQQLFGRSLFADYKDIAHYSITTGLGLALLGALKTGFGALNRFFDSVLQRSMKAQASAVTKPPSLVARAPKAKAKKILERGWLKNRAYVLFIDGSVEIETLLGLRQFPSLREAKDFVS